MSTPVYVPVYAAFQHMSDPHRVVGLIYSNNRDECEQIAERNPNATVVELEPPGPGWTQRPDGTWDRAK